MPKSKLKASPKISPLFAKLKLEVKEELRLRVLAYKSILQWQNLARKKEQQLKSLRERATPKEIEKKMKLNLSTLAIRIHQVSVKIGKPTYKPNYNDSRELNLIFKVLDKLPKDIAQKLSEYIRGE